MNIIFVLFHSKILTQLVVLHVAVKKVGNSPLPVTSPKKGTSGFEMDFFSKKNENSCGRFFILVSFNFNLKVNF